MQYWWVNHKQTFKQEFNGGYIWSPKANKNGGRNHSYDNMTRVQPGDKIFSFAGAAVQAIGTIQANCKESSKPKEFGKAGEQWDTQGWLVTVEWERLDTPLRPKDHIEVIRPHLSEKYAPIQANGNGNQGCYLACISEALAETVFSLLDYESPTETNQDIEDRAQQAIEVDNAIPETTKLQLIQARRGQGRYKRNLEMIETCCRITGTTDKRFLIASHIKPWKDASNEEKLDGSNGLLLAPHIDKLFDQGWISFTDEGSLLFADSSIKIQIKLWNIDENHNIGQLTSEQIKYLSYHREYVFRSRAVSQ